MKYLMPILALIVMCSVASAFTFDNAKKSSIDSVLARTGNLRAIIAPTVSLPDTHADLMVTGIQVVNYVEKDTLVESCYLTGGKADVHGDPEKSCSTTKIGTHKEEVDTWESFDTSTVPIGTMTIGLFVNVYGGDNIEWVPIIFGTQVTEWAGWTAGLNNGLKSYYTMDFNVNDSFLGKNNMTTGVIHWQSQSDDSLTATNFLAANIWQMMTVSWNKTSVLIYYNGTLNKTTLLTNKNMSSNTWYLFRDAASSAPNTFMDELSFWNRTLSDSEVSSLYNGGAGISFSSTPVVTLNSPPNTNSSTTLPISFNATCDSSLNALINMTLFIWNPSGSIINQTTVSITNFDNDSLIPVSNLNTNTYTWNEQCCAGTTCTFAPSNFTFNFGTEVKSNTFNATSYETSLEKYTLNVTTNQSLSAINFVFENVSHPTTLTNSGTNYQASVSQDISLGVRNAFWYWEIVNSTGSPLNLSLSSQNILALNFTICQPTVSKPFLNITFKNETISQQLVTAYVSESNIEYWLGDGSITKNLSYSNATENPSYAFCAAPPSASLNTLIDFFRYANSYSEQRTYSPSQMTLTIWFDYNHKHLCLWDSYYLLRPQLPIYFGSL